MLLRSLPPTCWTRGLEPSIFTPHPLSVVHRVVIIMPSSSLFRHFGQLPTDRLLIIASNWWPSYYILARNIVPQRSIGHVVCPCQTTSELGPDGREKFLMLGKQFLSSHPDPDEDVCWSVSPIKLIPTACCKYGLAGWKRKKADWVSGDGNVTKRIPRSIGGRLFLREWWVRENNFHGPLNHLSQEMKIRREERMQRKWDRSCCRVIQLISIAFLHTITTIIVASSQNGSMRDSTSSEEASSSWNFEYRTLSTRYSTIWYYYCYLFTAMLLTSAPGTHVHRGCK